MSPGQAVACSHDATAALDALPGWESGLFPAYEVRPGTHVRAPEAVVFRVGSRGFVTDGQFRRDPR